MARIPLRAYNREIENLIERGQIEEAIAHCKNILRQFPKNIETYRLLGKSFLESQRYTEAADILQRVLSVLPDDFVCQLGMSIIREDEGNLDAAIWHMERAYEVQPFNRAVQDELRRLYGRRDGVEPPRVRLTRGALVRMYARGDLYPQAIAEIRAALAEDHNRIDLLVLLARMYYLSGQKVEATEICSSLIGKLPYCLEANRILMEVLPETSRAEDARVFQQRLFSLDPYAAFISPNAPTSAQVPDQTVMVERVDWQPSMEEGQGPEWAKSIGVQWEESKEEALPDWLNNISAVPNEPAPPAAAFTAPEAEPLAEAPAGEDIIPDFLKDAGWEASHGSVDETAVSAIDEMPSGEEEIAEAEIPDWLQSLAPEQIKPAQGTTETPQTIEETGVDQSDLAWLEGIIPAEAAAETVDEVEPAPALPIDEAPSEALPADETPAWLRELGSTDQEQAAPTPAWGQEEALPSMEVEPPAAPGEELPDWLAQIQAEPLETPPAPTQAEEVTLPTASLPDEELPAWLDQVVPPSEESAPQPVEDAFQWPPTSEEAAQPGEAIPTGETQEALPGELPEWLSEVTAAQPPEESTTPSMEAPPPPDLAGETPYAAQESVPDWLKELSPEGALPPDLMAPEVTPEAPAAPMDEAFEGATSAPISEIAEPAQEPVQGSETPPGGEALPAWISELSQGGEPTIEAPAETVQQPEVTEPPAGNIQPETPEIQQPQAAAEPNLEDMDSALAWLEALAARQGADTESLKITSEEQRSEVPPDWIQNQMEATPVSEEFVEPVSEAAPEAVEEAPIIQPEAEPTPVEQAQEEIPAWLSAVPAAAASLETQDIPEVEETPAFEQPTSELSTEPPVIEPTLSELPTEEAAVIEPPISELPYEETTFVSEETVSALPAEEIPVAEQPVTDMMYEGAPSSELPVSEETLTPEQPVSEIPSEEAPVSEQPMPSGLPEWLTEIAEPPEQPNPLDVARSIEDTQPVKVSRPAETASEAIPEPVAEVSLPPVEPSGEGISADMDAEQAFAWLESLASRQGAEEETLITKPDERTETPPEWVETALSSEEVVETSAQMEETRLAAETAETPPISSIAEDMPAMPVMEEIAPEAVIEAPQASLEAAPPAVESTEEAQIPEWLRSYEEDQQKQPPVWEPTSETLAPEAIPEDRIPEWLRNEPEEPVLPVAEVPPVAPSKKDEEMISWISQLGETEPASANVEPVETGAAMEWLPEVDTAPSAPVETAPSIETALPASGDTAMLNEARRALSAGDLPTALDSYNALVNSNEMIDETIHDLREATGRYPADVMVWQTLGDAYIRGNQVQEALDAYTKAEDLLH